MKLKTFALKFLFSIFIFSSVVFGQERTSASMPWVVHDNYFFMRALDMKDFESTWSRTRQEVLAELMEHYNKALESGAKGDEAMYAVLNFERIYDMRKTSAARGMTDTIKAQFQSRLTEQYREKRIDPKNRHFIFKRGVEENGYKDINTIAYGAWSNINGYEVQVSISFVNLVTGEVVSFDENCPLKEMGHWLAEKVFKFFEENRYRPPQNPQPNLRWLEPAPEHLAREVTRNVAESYCAANGARIPFTSELELAGANGGYHGGGVSISFDSPYFIADETWNSDLLFYDRKPVPQRKHEPGYPYDNRGYLRPDYEQPYPGLIIRRNLARYFCVIGSPSVEVNFTQALFHAHRNIVRSDYSVDRAILCLLKESNARGYEYNEEASSRPCSYFETSGASPWEIIKKSKYSGYFQYTPIPQNIEQRINQKYGSSTRGGGIVPYRPR